MSGDQIRPLEEQDIPPIVLLWNDLFADTYIRPSADEEALLSKTFQSPQFDPGGSFVHENAGKLVGAVISLADRPRENDMCWHTSVAGWIGAILVKPNMQRKGIGTALLAEAAKHHEARGRHMILTGGGEGISALFPGVDERLKSARAFFLKHGYGHVRSTSFVDIDLTATETPTDVALKRAELVAEGYRFDETGPADEQRLIQHLKTEGDDAFDEIMEIWHRNPASTIACFSDNLIVGIVRGSRVIDGKAGYSMISTLESERGRGIGKALLAETLDKCRERGGKTMPLWTRPETAGRFYHKLGFHTEREYLVYGKAISQNFASKEWISRNRFL